MKNTPRLFTLVAALVAATLAPAKPFPSGIYALLKGDVARDPAWTNINTDGGRYRGSWNDIQPNSATDYDWSTTEAAVAAASTHGKKLGISLAGGTNTPDWVYAIRGVTKFHLEVSSVAGNGYIPLPWELPYQAAVLKFIAAFGARYDGDPTVSYVVMTGFQQMVETRLVTTTGDYDKLNVLAKAAGFADADAAFIDGTEKIIDGFVKAFPSTAVMITTATSYLPTSADIQTIRKWGLATYPKHFGPMTASLRATLPPHPAAPSPVDFPKGFQFIYDASNPATYDPPLTTSTMPAAPQPLQDGLENAWSEGAQYVEVYEADLTAAVNQTVLAVQRDKLKQNSPSSGAPEAPTNLHIISSSF